MWLLIESGFIFSIDIFSLTSSSGVKTIPCGSNFDAAAEITSLTIQILVISCLIRVFLMADSRLTSVILTFAVSIIIPDMPYLFISSGDNDIPE